jgi:serine/threonine protein kinase
MIGRTFLHYKILEKISEGGMSSFSKKYNKLILLAGGVVYKALDTKLNWEVAIKFLTHRIAPSEEERQRFKIEAQAAAALNHPNIATIYAVEEVDGETRLALLVKEHKIKTAQEETNIIIDRVRNHAKDRPQMEDVTLVFIKRIETWQNTIILLLKIISN